jgi:imidazolonepropionase-like amidohydrolase
LILARTFRSFGVFPVFITATCLQSSAQAQDPPVALVGARIIPVQGPVIPKGSIVLANGKVQAVGANVAMPANARRIDVTGKVIIPGLIDTHSSLFLSESDLAGAGSADRDILDAADLFDDDAEKVLARGVTTVYLSPGRRSSVGGLGAVVKLAPVRDSTGVLATPLRPQAALKLNLGLATNNRSSSLERLASYESLRTTFRSAQQYARSLERYEREVKIFDAQPRQTRAQASPQEVSQETQTSGQRPSEGPSQRPVRPRKQPAQEAILRALRREIPVRIEVSRADDILNALRLADEFKLRLILERATEAPLVAREIVKRNVPIVWGPTLLDSPPGLDSKSHSPAGAAKLSKVGIRIALTPAGALGRESRFVLENAAAAAGYGLTQQAALRAITLDAARILDVADRVGSLSPGKDADLVVLSADPWDPAARVEKVFVNGEQLYGR